MGIVTQVLSISCIIIGVYILGIMILGEKETAIQSPQYHIGCFLAQHNVTHSWQIESAVRGLQAKMGAGLTYRSSRLSLDYLSTRGNQVARSFDLFLGELARQKEEMRNYVELARATRKAQAQYRNCSSIVLLQQPQPKKCQNIWLQYQNCSTGLNFLKSQISKLFLQKQVIQQKIKKGFEAADKGTQPKPQPDTNEKAYRAKDKELEVEQKTIESNLKIINEKVISTEYNFAVAQNETLNSRMLYHECTQHRNQFRLCEELSADVRSLGYGTLEGLGQKLEKKRISIMKIKTMLNGDEHQRQREELHMLSVAEYKKLYKIFAEIKTKMVKNCGCTESEEAKLLEVFQGHVREEHSIRAQLLALRDEQAQLYKQLNLVKERRRLLFTEFHTKPQEKTKPISSQITMVEILKSLEQQQTQLKSKILSYESQFSSLAQSCQANRQELSFLLAIFSSISDCRTKKDYYLTLQQSLTKNTKQLNFDLLGKERLVKALRQFVI